MADWAATAEMAATERSALPEKICPSTTMVASRVVQAARPALPDWRVSRASKEHLVRMATAVTAASGAMVFWVVTAVMAATAVFPCRGSEATEDWAATAVTGLQEPMLLFREALEQTESMAALEAMVVWAAAVLSLALTEAVATAVMVVMAVSVVTVT